MKIARIESIPVRIPLTPERKMVSSLGRHEVSDFVLVRVESEDGCEGVGEATVTPRWSGETTWGAKAMIDGVLANAVHGWDPRDIAGLTQKMNSVAEHNWFAKAAIEMACWDLVGRAEGKPVYELLGGLCRDRTITCRFSMGAYPAEVAAERAAKRIQEGFTTIKVKVGRGADEDLARVTAVREAIGPDNHLTIDANGGWNFDQATQSLEAMRGLGIEIVEQPLPRGDYQRLRLLREETGVRILADESCFDFVQAEELITQQCCDALTVYPGKHGGIGEAVRIAQKAEARGLPCTIGSNLEWDVGAAAMMHFIVATKNVAVETLPGDCLGPSYHAFSIAKNPLIIEGPRVTVHDKPGLGIEVDWDVVAANRIPCPWDASVASGTPKTG